MSENLREQLMAGEVRDFLENLEEGSTELPDSIELPDGLYEADELLGMIDHVARLISIPYEPIALRIIAGVTDAWVRIGYDLGQKAEGDRGVSLAQRAHFLMHLSGLYLGDTRSLEMVHIPEPVSLALLEDRQLALDAYAGISMFGADNIAAGLIVSFLKLGYRLGEMSVPT